MIQMVSFGLETDKGLCLFNYETEELQDIVKGVRKKYSSR